MGRGANGLIIVGVILAGFFWIAIYWGPSFLVMNAVSKNAAPFLEAMSIANEFENPSGAFETADNRPVTVLAQNGKPARKWDIAAHMELAVFSDYRTVRTTRMVDITDLLADGETLPEPDLLDLFVEARLARLAERDCAVLREALASTCTASGFRATAQEGTIYRVRVEMNFISRVPVGPVPPSDRLLLHERRFAYDTELAAPPAQADQDAAHGKLYEAALTACNEIRGQFGNCAIKSIDSGQRPEKLTGQLVLSWLTSVEPIAAPVQQAAVGEAPATDRPPFRGGVFAPGGAQSTLPQPRDLGRDAQRARQAAERDQTAALLRATGEYDRAGTPYEISVAGATGEPLPEPVTVPTPTVTQVDPDLPQTEPALAETAPEPADGIDGEASVADPAVEPMIAQREAWRRQARIMFETGQPQPRQAVTEEATEVDG